MQSAGKQIPLDLTFRASQGREDFLVAESNLSAVNWIDGWPKSWSTPVLIITGAAASGKSHLANVWKDMAQATQIAPDMLVNHTAENIAQMGKHLLIDGVDLWLGDRTAETTLFHLYNMFKEEGRTMLVTMRMNPAQADFAIADLASRWRGSPLAVIKEPDDLLLQAVLVKQFSDHGLKIEEGVINYVLPRMERSFKAAYDIVALASEMAMAEKKPVSVSLMRKVLAELQFSGPLFD